MVFENTKEFPTPEGAQRRCPPPSSTYGFQKLATEYFAQGAWEQYKLPYTIARPFNCVGVGEKRALCDRDIMSGNVKLAMSHVVPDLVQKVLKGQDPLHILGSGNQVRHYTYGGDLAKGIRVCIEHPAAMNDDFNLSTPARTTVLELAEVDLEEDSRRAASRFATSPIRRSSTMCRNVRRSSPKPKRSWASKRPTTLDEILDEVIPWIEEQISLGQDV